MVKEGDMKRDNRKVQLWCIRIFTILLLAGCSEKTIIGITDGNRAKTVIEIPSEAIYALKSSEDLDVLLEEIGDAKLVLLGEASHGTSEFYTWRAELSQRLIEEKGFSIIAVEGDWTDALPLNNYINGVSSQPTAQAALSGFDRWPTWMWANEEVRDLAEWLHTYNSGRTGGEQVNFYGLDVYGMWESLEAVRAYLQTAAPSKEASAQNVIACFAPYNGDEMAYARATLNSGTTCENVISDMVDAVKNSIVDHDNMTFTEFNALQNVYVVANAETYYRTAVRSYSLSWNVRDLHMAGTMDRILKYHGNETGIIVWEHNTHVGDARATDMADVGMINIGQLVRETYGNDEVYIVGFGTYSGKVIAAPGWGAAARAMDVPAAQKNSWEWTLHREAPLDKILIMDPLKSLPQFNRRIRHRAIGVVYDPQSEGGNYVPSVLPERYDAFIFIDKTTALKPLSAE